MAKGEIKEKEIEAPITKIPSELQGIREYSFNEEIALPNGTVKIISAKKVNIIETSAGPVSSPEGVAAIKLDFESNIEFNPIGIAVLEPGPGETGIAIGVVTKNNNRFFPSMPCVIDKEISKKAVWGMEENCTEVEPIGTYVFIPKYKSEWCEKATKEEWCKVHNESYIEKTCDEKYAQHFNETCMSGEAYAVVVYKYHTGFSILLPFIPITTYEPIGWVKI